MAGEDDHVIPLGAHIGERCIGFSFGFVFGRGEHMCFVVSCAESSGWVKVLYVFAQGV